MAFAASRRFTGRPAHRAIDRIRLHQSQYRKDAQACPRVGAWLAAELLCRPASLRVAADARKASQWIPPVWKKNGSVLGEVRREPGKHIRETFGVELTVPSIPLPRVSVEEGVQSF
jgi:hypothetical protein